MKKERKDVGTVIGRGCTIKDNTISAIGPVLFEGDFSGTVNCQSEVTVGQNGYVDGIINSDVIVVAGRFEGDVTARSLVHIQPSGIVSGHIHTDKIVIDEGGTLNGAVEMEEAKEKSRGGDE